jgi:hypothetical protein
MYFHFGGSAWLLLYRIAFSSATKFGSLAARSRFT